jgi:hypothetical protein
MENTAPFAEDTRPTITKKEVSWHATVAAIRARKQAELQGIDPDAKAAFLHAARAEGQVNRPIISLGTLWAIRETEQFLSEICGTDAELDQVFLAHTLLNAEDVLLLALERNVEALKAGMLASAITIPVRDAVSLVTFFNQEIERVNRMTGGLAEPSAKKLETQGASKNPQESPVAGSSP